MELPLRPPTAFVSKKKPGWMSELAVQWEAVFPTGNES